MSNVCIEFQFRTNSEFLHIRLQYHFQSNDVRIRTVHMYAKYIFACLIQWNIRRFASCEEETHFGSARGRYHSRI